LNSGRKPKIVLLGIEKSGKVAERFGFGGTSCGRIKKNLKTQNEHQFLNALKHR
jgi:hypothetical protein